MSMPTLPKSLGVIRATVATALLDLQHAGRLYGAANLAIILNIGLDADGNVVISVQVAQREGTTRGVRRQRTR